MAPTMLELGFRVRVITDVIRLQSAAITVAVIIAECIRMTSMIMPANVNAAMINHSQSEMQSQICAGLL